MQPPTKKQPRFDGPIPGENYTSDTKNYPWHRPPDEADFVSVVEKAVKGLSEPEKMGVVLTALESGDTILDFVAGSARVSVGNGKLPIDMAILAAGPIARFIEVMAQKAHIKYERGFDPEPRMLTKARVDAYRGAPEAPAPPPTAEPAGPPGAGGGLMAAGASGPNEQDEMLGYGSEGAI